MAAAGARLRGDSSAGQSVLCSGSRRSQFPACVLSHQAVGGPAPESILSCDCPDQVADSLLISPGHEGRLVVTPGITPIELREMLVNKCQEGSLGTWLEKKWIRIEEAGIRVARFTGHDVQRRGIVGDARHQRRTHYARSQPRFAQPSNGAEAQIGPRRAGF